MRKQYRKLELQMFAELHPDTAGNAGDGEEDPAEALIQRLMRSRQRIVDVNRSLLASQQRLDKIYNMVKQDQQGGNLQ